MEIESRNSISQEHRELLESLLSGYNRVVINSSSRITTINDYTDDGTFYIFESSLPRGYSNGNWESYDSIKVNEVEVLLEPTRCLSGECRGEGIEIRSDDTNRYVAYYEPEHLLLLINIDKMTVDGLSKIFELCNVTPISPKERFYKNMRRIIEGGTEDQIKRITGEIERHKERMSATFRQYMNTRKELEDRMIRLHGLENKEFDEDGFLEKFERLFTSEYLEEAIITNDKMILTTKPLSIWKWVIGQYRIEYYYIGSEHLNVERITPPVDYELCVVIPVEGMDEQRIQIQSSHPHVSGGGMCMGNAHQILSSIWNRDYLTTFQFMIQFLRSYSSRDPYLKFVEYVATLGYVSDASVLLRNGSIKKIDDGKLYDRDNNELDTEELEAWGCTGELNSKEDLEKIYADSRFKKEVDSIRAGTVYHSRGYNISQYTCSYCGELIEGEEYNVSGEVVCEHCHDNYTFNCERCGNSYHEDYAYYVEDYSYCEDCASEISTRCNGCSDRIFNENILEVEGESYCNHCARESGVCVTCNERFWTSIMIRHDGVLYCVDCYESREVSDNDE